MKNLVVVLLILVCTSIANAQQPVVSSEIAKDIQFGLKSDKIFSSSYPVLDKLAIIMTNHKEVSIQITAYADSYEGRAEYNTRLSGKRADAIYQYLINKGIDAYRLHIETMDYSKTKTIEMHKSLEKGVIIEIRQLGE